MTMRRRLTFAIFGIALAAVVLVGLGVLLLAQFGARQEARDQVQEQLEILESFIRVFSPNAERSLLVVV